MALTERTRPYQVLIDFPTANTYSVRYREIVEILRGDEVINQSSSEPQPTLPAGEQVPDTLAAVFGEVAAQVILSNQQAAADHEARLQEIADMRTRAEQAEQLAADRLVRAESAEARLAVVAQAVAPTF